MNNFEFDKIVIALAFACFALVFSSHMGNLLYIPEGEPIKQGFAIEVVESSGVGQVVKKGLPEVLDMKVIMANANIEIGKKVFNKCSVCHTNNKGGKNKIGPNLWNIVGHKIAVKGSFAYSKAMKAKGEATANWSYEELYRYLYAPKKYVVGTKMAFAGIKNDEQRAGLLAYLRSMADAPLKLPQ